MPLLARQFLRPKHSMRNAQEVSLLDLSKPTTTLGGSFPFRASLCAGMEGGNKRGCDLLAESPTPPQLIYERYERLKNYDSN